MAAGYPFLAACGKKVEAGIAAVSLDGSSIELTKAAVNELTEAVTGAVLLANDPGYDTARKIWNGMHDKRPALIVQPSGTDDVVKAVGFARDNSLLLAVKGGGHSWPGKSAVEGGMMIDLSNLTQVDVDREARVAKAGGGALLSNLDTAALEQGLVTTAGVVSHTGIGGFTLGGGFGRLNRKFGLAIDNLVGAEIVTADGKVHYVSADEESELFWALRGGGGNFGVVTRFDYRLHPFDRNVLSGMIMWPIDQAKDVLEFYGEWHSGLSRDLYVGPVMVTTPDGASLVGMEVLYAGDPAAGEKEMAALRAIGKPADDGIKLQDYTVMQTQEDVTFAHGIRSYIKNGMVKSVTPELVTQLVESFRADPRLAFFTHTAGGAVMDVGELDTAFPHRNAETMIMVGGGWTDPADDEPAMAEARSWFSELEPYTGGYYDNIYFGADDSVSENYGPNYPRLQKIKAQYDPGNLFRLNSNIEPA
jgi:hypothetical protein